MRLPLATYRIQFNSEFGFTAAQEIAAYLKSLGISDLYASPIFKARAGSPHGYDVVDPTQLNPELGEQADFESLVQQLQAQQMGWLQDIVPNHMAYDGDNLWLMDVLENGSASSYLSYFDIAWNSPFDSNQAAVLVPLLGNFYGESLENGEIQIQYDQTGLSVGYYSLKIPLKLESYATLMTHNLGALAKALGRNHPVFVRLLGILYSIKSVPSDISGKQRQDQVAFVKSLLWDLYCDQSEVKSFIDDNIKTFNGNPGEPSSYDLLDNLLTDQYFRLAYWKVGAEEMNYRRFFTVNELISVRVEQLKIFNATHTLIFDLVNQGKFTGLRVDHIDGLYNPTEYLDRLREKVGDTYVSVEKILQPGEDLPQIWKTEGTSGYDYLNYVNGVFCQSENQAKFDQIYRQFTGKTASIETVIDQTKRLILDKNLAGDVDNLATILKQISERYRYGNDFTINSLRRAIIELLVHFSVYRTYTTDTGVLETDRPYIAEAIQASREQVPLLRNELNFIEKLLLLDYDESLPQVEKDKWIYWVMRVQQYTGPLMAKGVEDTALYIYYRLLSLNEVGGDPARFGVSLDEFHQFNRARQADWPYAMSTTSTHDTKRGEDVRARLNVLSEIPERWQQQVERWSQINERHKTSFKFNRYPDRNDEYALYQTIVGTLPFASSLAGFTERIKDFMLKAIREAKVYTTWLSNNPVYEDACSKFIEAILNDSEDNQFLQELRPFQQQVAHYGVLNSLAQTLLKLTTPGIPDFYQGSELWDLSLVDPDNRRPVDFEQRQADLHEMQHKLSADIAGLLPELLAHPADGRIKLFLTMQGLKARADYAALFLEGGYQPLQTSGKFANHLIALARTHQTKTVVTVVPRFCTGLVEAGAYPLGEVWQDTAIQLPEATGWKNLLTGQLTAGTNQASDILSQFPVALLAAG
ncbi:MAG: malto-oligosyltrehalose synthase [Pegethrix bostrychoides GSE-TBD4-15B]|jgi:(1->4)-alpha-D-glucan 1-alpha-D-glucosylmutase|uniref:Malto-oligosyltrehalose synthase n=1 Tax=Pegethrix bostrychoides GSE-TBD4-15B TaxID=2839662 RepID=A0A951P9P1_9CYAN|nr:malto-oligosyltrehalose synthase [Pegethrix bostrychoides GSE-TBD4-15B]